MIYSYPRAVMVGVVDGDTCDIAIDYGFHLTQTHRVRLTGIDAPEVNAAGPEGEAARDWLRALLPVGTPVRLLTHKPKDKFGRYLAWVFLADSDVSVNEQLIRAGHAVAYDGGAR